MSIFLTGRKDISILFDATGGTYIIEDVEIYGDSKLVINQVLKSAITMKFRDVVNDEHAVFSRSANEGSLAFP